MIFILMGDVTGEASAQHMGKHVGTVEVEIIFLNDAGNSFQNFSNPIRTSPLLNKYY